MMAKHSFKYTSVPLNHKIASDSYKSSIIFKNCFLTLTKSYMKKIIFLFFTFHFSLLTLNAQPVSQEWAKYYDSGTEDCQSAGIGLDTFGNVYIAGKIQTETQNSNYITLKYNNSGAQQWVAFYNGPGTNSIDRATAIAVDPQGNVYVTGYSEATGFQTDDYLTVKYNTTGAQLWTARYNGPGNGIDDVSSIAVDKNGFVYVTGRSIGIGTNYDIATIKYYPNGDTVWVRRYNGTGNSDDYAGSVGVDSLGNVYVACYLNTTINLSVIKYNSIGQFQWVATSVQGYFPKLSLDKLGNVYLIGRTNNPNPPYDDYVTVKYNGQGVQQWASFYNGLANSMDQPNAVKIDDSGNVYVTGRSSGAGTDFDYATVKYNSTGTQQWVRRYNGTGNYYDDATDLVIDNQSNVYVTGASVELGHSSDFTTIKYNAAGTQQWLISYNGPPGNGDDYASAIAIDKAKNLYVTGISDIGGLTFQLLTIKYSQFVGVNKTNEHMPNTSTLYQNYPNPFNSSTVIRFDIKILNNEEMVKTELLIYDCLGNLVTLLLNRNLKSGSYDIHFNTDRLSSGVYFCRLSINGEINKVIPMALIK